MAPIHTTIKAAALAAATLLAAGAIAPVTSASAAESLSLHFGVGANGQASFGFSFDANGYPQQGPGTYRPPAEPRGNGYGQTGGRFDACLSEREVVNGLRDLGYRRVEVTGSGRRTTEVEADYRRMHYVLEVNRCTGYVEIVDRWFTRVPGLPPRPGLSFQYSTLR